MVYTLAGPTPPRPNYCRGSRFSGVLLMRPAQKAGKRAKQLAQQMRESEQGQDIISRFWANRDTPFDEQLLKAMFGAKGLQEMRAQRASGEGDPRAASAGASSSAGGTA